MALTPQEKQSLLKSQQGELDAVLMYQKLAQAVKHPREADCFRQLAAEEGGHAAVFFHLTQTKLEPKKTLAVVVPLLYRILGKKRVYPIIAKSEYGAADGYAHLTERFPAVAQIQNDETRHGDMVRSLLD